MGISEKPWSKWRFEMVKSTLTMVTMDVEIQ